MRGEYQACLPQLEDALKGQGHLATRFHFRDGHIFAEGYECQSLRNIEDGIVHGAQDYAFIRAKEATYK